MMKYEIIEQYVTKLLTLSAVDKEGMEQTVGSALYHLLMSAAIRDLMSDEEKELFSELSKKLQYFFCTRLNLKERKGKQKKENFPPTPLIKEKQKKGKEEKKTHTAVGEILNGFYLYWSEEDPKTGKMLFEKEQTWNLDFRLERWESNPYTVVRAYGKSELAMIYFPKDSQETATNKFRNWLRINPRLKGFIDRSARCYTPKQVRRIVEEVGEPFSTE